MSVCFFTCIRRSKKIPTVCLACQDYILRYKNTNRCGRFVIFFATRAK
jgi:hypothetical protein